LRRELPAVAAAELAAVPACAELPAVAAAELPAVRTTELPAIPAAELPAVRTTELPAVPAAAELPGVRLSDSSLMTRADIAAAFADRALGNVEVTRPTVGVLVRLADHRGVVGGAGRDDVGVAVR
jgi:hypothetical protein